MKIYVNDPPTLYINHLNNKLIISMDDTDLDALGRPASGHWDSLLDVTTEARDLYKL